MTDDSNDRSGDPVEVTIRQGRVRGMRRPGGSTAFLGIPFADTPDDRAVVRRHP